MIEIDQKLRTVDLLPAIQVMWQSSAAKIRAIESSWDSSVGSPVFTVAGRYTARGWTEWTQGFQFGSAILQYDATEDEEFLSTGRRQTVDCMAPHVTHFGVHDHGFNNVSTYGNLLRLMNENRIAENVWEREFYRLALKCSGAVQARRWTCIADGGGYIYSFNGPQSLFADTIRSLRAVAWAHRLGHILMDEHDEKVSLLGRLIDHAQTTARYTVFYGQGRDKWDIRGRVTHECIFNLNDGNFRCPNTQQGYSCFTTWTRGLAWVMLGYPEQLEFLQTLPQNNFTESTSKSECVEFMEKAARATCDFYLEYTPADGIPYWDTGAPLLHKLGDYLSRPADPFNEYEPVDASAAAIAAQGLLRLGQYMKNHGHSDSDRYFQAGLTVARTLLREPYLSTDDRHQGLLLHSVYHRPNDWDYIPDGATTPRGESSMWGDYHLRELALYIQRLAQSQTYYTFFGPPEFS